jgi:hypothetical protein
VRSKTEKLRKCKHLLARVIVWPLGSYVLTCACCTKHASFARVSLGSLAALPIVSVEPLATLTRPMLPLPAFTSCHKQTHDWNYASIIQRLHV